MKKKLNKIKDIIKNNYRIIIPLLLILVLFIAFFTYYKFVILDNKTYIEKNSFYQYFYAQKYEYTGKVTTNRKNLIVSFEAIDYDVKTGSVPIYYSNKNKVIFPHRMSVVMPTLNCAEYKISKYAYLDLKSNYAILHDVGYKNRLGRYFLYDGKDLYFFLDEVTLKVGNKEIKLSPYSYIEAKYNNNYISYYDKDNDSAEIIETNNKDIYISNDYYKIYVMEDRLDYYDTEVIITSNIKELNPIRMKGN